MINAITSSSYAQAIARTENEDRTRRTPQAPGKGDSFSFSQEAYAALEASRNVSTQQSSAMSPWDKAHPVADNTPGNPAANATENSEKGTEKSLLEQLKEYIKNPTLKHAMDKMEQTVAALDYDEWTAKTVLEQVEAAFRSGIPAKGEQTSDAMANLRKNIKDETGLNDADISELMEKIGFVIAEAQENDPGVKEGSGSGKTERA